MTIFQDQLANVSLDEALDLWLSDLEFRGALEISGVEVVSIEESLGRVTAEPIMAKVPYPHYYSVAVDGMAVKSTDLYHASHSSPVKLKIGEDAVFVDIGRPIPKGFDAVIPMEKVNFISVEEMQVTERINLWQNIKPVGEDVAAREVIFPANHRIRPMDVGAILLGGVRKIKVREKPKVGIVSIGNDLIPLDVKLEEGKQYENVSIMVKIYALELGALPKIYDICDEKLEIVEKKLVEIVKEQQLVILVAGASWGTQLIAKAIENTGELLMFGINIKPGRSVALGIVDGKPVIGLPRYPVAAYVSHHHFAKPVIKILLSLEEEEKKPLSAFNTKAIYSPLDIEEFLRVNLCIVDEKFVAVPISRGTDILMSLVRADGMARIPANTTQVDPGEVLKVETIVPKRQLVNSLLISGTYDIIFELLRNELMQLRPQIRLITNNIGSFQGLKLLKKGLTHLSGIHLFDPESGRFNVPFIEKYLPDLPVVLVRLFDRKLGLIVQAQNPKNVTSLEALTRGDIVFANRNKQSGTRVFLDYYLAKNKIKPENIKGYDNEIFTHMSLAQAVASGNCDAGFGIHTAAKAFKLDFIPLFPEEFDLLIPKKIFESSIIQKLLKVITGKKFNKEVLTNLEGYDLSRTGEIIYE